MKERLKALIAEHGPIGIDAFMRHCLYDEAEGYYRRQNPIGAAGDFITAPEISQMFGELIGLWAAVVWQGMGSPDPLWLVEFGPGRGTLMADALRAIAMVPDFARAARPCLVETSETLRRIQQDKLGEDRALWVETAEALPDGPMIAIANEFFDALPIRQFVLGADGWRERLVGLVEGALAFVMGEAASIQAPDAEPGDIFEINEPGRALAGRIGRRLSRSGGAMLIVDYGHAKSAAGDSLQALRKHRPVPVLDEPGEADLTAHVDFAALAEAARPAAATPVVTQGAFLCRLGIEWRAEKLARAVPAKAPDIALGCRRLIDPLQMGTLFKVMAIHDPDLPALPGFDKS